MRHARCRMPASAQTSVQSVSPQRPLIKDDRRRKVDKLRNAHYDFDPMRIDPAVILALVLVLAPFVAQADCKTVPRPVARFASTFPGWTLVTTDDFEDQDWADWKYDKQSGECPGFFRLRWDGSGKDVYAVALFNRSVTKRERVDVISNEDHPRIIAHLDDMSMGGPWVIFRAKPGYYGSAIDGSRARLERDGVWVQLFEANDTLYYFQNGATKAFSIS